MNATTGLYDLPFRNYDATLGRFFQVDPLAYTSSDMTSYHYVGNNPIGYNDPTGLMQKSPYTDEQEYQAAKIVNDYFSWAMDSIHPYASGGSQMEQDAAAVLNGTMSLSAYANMYGTSISPENFVGMIAALTQGGLSISNSGYISLTYAEYDGVGNFQNAVFETVRVDPKNMSAAILSNGSFWETDMGQDVSDTGKGIKEFGAGFWDSSKPNDFSANSSKAGYLGFIFDAIGNGVKYGHNGRFSDLRQVVKSERIFSKIGLVGGIINVGMTTQEAFSDGNFSYGDGFKVALGIAQIGLAFTPIGWGVFAYNAADLTVGLITGTNITDRIANGIDNIGK